MRRVFRTIRPVTLVGVLSKASYTTNIEFFYSHRASFLPLASLPSIYFPSLLSAFRPTPVPFLFSSSSSWSSWSCSSSCPVSKGSPGPSSHLFVSSISTSSNFIARRHFPLLIFGSFDVSYPRCRLVLANPEALPSDTLVHRLRVRSFLFFSPRLRWGFARACARLMLHGASVSIIHCAVAGPRPLHYSWTRRGCRARRSTREGVSRRIYDHNLYVFYAVCRSLVSLGVSGSPREAIKKLSG